MQLEENSIKKMQAYNPNDHMFINFTLLLGSFLWYLILAPSIGLLAIIYMVLGYYLSAFVFYNLHRHPLHRRAKATRAIFDLHTNVHHKFFSENPITITEIEQYQFVLMPSGVIVSLVLIVYPLAFYFLDLVFSESLAYWLLIGAQWMFIQYEICHLHSHSDDSAFSAFQHINKMALNHRKHHENCQYNFGIATDVFDKYYNTKAK